MGLAAGVLGGLEQAAELAQAFDVLVAGRCVVADDCAGTRSFPEAGKPAYLVACTNNARRVPTYCALAVKAGVPLIFKTEFPNGKLHRRRRLGSESRNLGTAFDAPWRSHRARLVIEPATWGHAPMVLRGNGPCRSPSDRRRCPAALACAKFWTDWHERCRPRADCTSW